MRRALALGALASLAALAWAALLAAREYARPRGERSW